MAGGEAGAATLDQEMEAGGVEDGGAQDGGALSPQASLLTTAAGSRMGLFSWSAMAALAAPEDRL